MAPTTKKNSKPIFKTGIPFTETSWPQLSVADRENILDLLCDLLQPLGAYRRIHTHPSKGKNRKRKRKHKPHPANPSLSAEEEDAATPAPPPPEIKHHLLVGLNSVTQHLEALAARSAPETMPRSQEHEHSINESPSKDPLRPLSLLLIPHNHPPSSLPYAHLPTLVHLSSSPSPSTPSQPPSSSSESAPAATPATRFIAVPPACEARLAEALHIPHVGALGLLAGAPGASALETYVQQHVGPTECRWIDEARAGEWKGVKIAGR